MLAYADVSARHRQSPGGADPCRYGEASHPATKVLVVAGVVLLCLFFAIERRVAWPMMDLICSAFAFSWPANASLLLNALARGSTMFIMSWYFQTVLNDQPLIAALKITPWSCR